MTGERKVEDAPREGHPGQSRYILIAGAAVVGWTDSRRTAIRWRRGFGPGVSVEVWDKIRGETLIPLGAGEAS